jgi:hypothetical protein
MSIITDKSRGPIEGILPQHHGAAALPRNEALSQTQLSTILLSMLYILRAHGKPGY